jgi:hypothetical protein
MIITNVKPELHIDLETDFHQLAKNIHKEKPYEPTSVCYLLKDQDCAR